MATETNNGTGTSEVELRDEFGRLPSERIVELQPIDAEKVNVEVVAGKHQTYDDALAYVLSRGFAEIARQRDSAAKLNAQRKLSASMAKFNDLLAKNPTLAANPQALQAVAASCGPEIAALCKQLTAQAPPPPTT